MGSMSFMRFPQGWSIHNQQCFRVSIAGCSYCLGAPRFPLDPDFRLWPRITLLACLRFHPVNAINSSSILVLAFLPVMRAYLSRIFSVYSSMLFSLIAMVGVECPHLWGNGSYSMHLEFFFAVRFNEATRNICWFLIVFDYWISYDASCGRGGYFNIKNHRPVCIHLPNLATTTPQKNVSTRNIQYSPWL